MMMAYYKLQRTAPRWITAPKIIIGLYFLCAHISVATIRPQPIVIDNFIAIVWLLQHHIRALFSDRNTNIFHNNV